MTMKLQQLGVFCMLLSVAAFALANEGEQHVEVYGSQCAAYLEGVSVLDLANPAQGGVPTHLQVDMEESTFNCDSNSTQLLVLKIAPENAAYDGSQIINIG